MSANEFEKQVQQTMDGWKIPPGENVWVEVEKRIRKEKRRRGLIIFFIGMFLLLGGGMATFMLVSNKRKQKQEIADTKHEQPIQKNETIKNNKISTTNKPTINPVSKEGESENKTESDESITTVKDKKPVAAAKSKKVNAERKQQDIFLVKNKPNREKESPAKQEIQPEKKKELQNETEKSLETVLLKVKDAEPVKPVENKSSIVSEIKRSDSVAKESITREEKLTDIPGIDSTKTEPNKDKKKSKINWSVNLQAGRSSYVEGFGFFGEKMLYASPLATGPGGGIINIESPKPGLSLALSVQARQTISNRLAINYSGGYNYLSTRQKVGNRFDTSILVSPGGSPGTLADANYRASGSGSIISNQFHFLDLSAELSWKIINGKKSGVWWNNGIRYDWLIASRVYHYDSRSMTFYKNPDMLTHHHFFLQTSLTIPVSKRFSLSPFAAYSLTPVMKYRSDTASFHFGNYGLRLTISLGQRK